MISNVNIPTDSDINNQPHIIQGIIFKDELAFSSFQEYIMNEKSRREILNNGNTCMLPTFGNTFFQKMIFSPLVDILIAISLVPVVVVYAIFSIKLLVNILGMHPSNSTVFIAPLKAVMVLMAFSMMSLVPFILLILCLEKCRKLIWRDIIADNKLRDTLGRRNHWWNTKVGDVFYKELCSSNSETIKVLDIHSWMAMEHVREIASAEHCNSSVIHVWERRESCLYELLRSSFSISDTLCTECVRSFGDWRPPPIRESVREPIPPERKDVQTLVLTKNPGEIWCLIQNIDDLGPHMEKGNIMHVRGKLEQKLDDSLFLDQSIDDSDRTKFPVMELMVHPLKMDHVTGMVAPITEEEIINSLKIAGISC